MKIKNVKNYPKLKVTMKVWVFLVLLVAATGAINFINTVKLYNGTIGGSSYKGFAIGCKSAKPCTIVQLLEGQVWNYPQLADCWILDLTINCAGYLTNSSYTIGTCLLMQYGQLSTCTCNMLLPLCCYY